MSRGQIRMCGRPRVGVFFFPLKTGGFGPMATGQSNRPVTRYLMPRCAPSAVPGQDAWLTPAQSATFEELFSQVVDADDVEHRSLAHPRSGCLSPSLALAGPCAGFRVALLASPNQSQNPCPALVLPAIFRRPEPSLSQDFRPSCRTMTPLVRYGRTILPRHLKSLKAAMP